MGLRQDILVEDPVERLVGFVRDRQDVFPTVLVWFDMIRGLSGQHRLTTAQRPGMPGSAPVLQETQGGQRTARTPLTASTFSGGPGRESETPPG
jgi:hypothetical protein